MEYNQENMFCIIPFRVLEDERLSSSEKLLFALISGLCNKNGYCWATNQYLSDKLKLKTKKYISELIKNLEQNNYIRVELIYKDGTMQIEQRRIYLKLDAPIDENVNTPIDENVNTPIDENVNTPIDENVNTPIPKKRDTPIPKKRDTPIPKKRDTPIPKNWDTPIPKNWEDNNKSFKNKSFKRVCEDTHTHTHTHAQKTCLDINTPNELKRTYGEFNKVRLLDTEYSKLLETYGQNKTDDYISQLDRRIASDGKSYKSHYATIQIWICRDDKKIVNENKDIKPYSVKPKQNRFANFTQRDWDNDMLKQLETAYLRQ